MSRIHFISGLPRSGSTLLAGILRQNPRCHAAMSSPLATVVTAVIRAANAPNELSVFVSDEQRRRMVHRVIEAYYECVIPAVVFDTSRQWCALLGVVATLFPTARVICCVRSPAWIIDSTERFIQMDPFMSSRLFDNDISMTIYDRAQAMLRGQYLGGALNGLKQAFYSEFADRLIVVRYDSLVQRPAEVMRALYEAIGEESAEHDFKNVRYEEAEFDKALGLPGFHTVGRKVEPRPRPTCLPLELFQQHTRCFWDDDPNPRNVRIL